MRNNKRSFGPKKHPSGHRRPTSDRQQPLNPQKAPRQQYPANPQESKYYGFHACMNLWKSRPDDVIRVYVEQKRVKEASPLLKWCASKNKAYHIVSPEELAKVSDSVHHEGLCVLAKDVPEFSFVEMMDALAHQEKPVCLLYLDGVQNPHNIGSIMRVCAHFGIQYILGQRQLLPKVSPSAYRVAQGGAECVNLVPIDNLKKAFQMLEKAGFRALTSSSHGAKSLYQHKFHPRTIVVMGSESEGINPVLLESTKDAVLIPGTGAVESLNVSVATGLFLGEFWRQLGPKS